MAKKKKKTSPPRLDKKLDQAVKAAYRLGLMDGEALAYRKVRLLRELQLTNSQ